ncbi:MAG: hypothetical protein CVV49_11495 [Spirochaetae bacterium HGW-Spirochaetae-5]|nr:MAG: hypothetical protein CVV49_11495 [Spirochaetae bacterium HGW-Spirochaetae-5]
MEEPDVSSENIETESAELEKTWRQSLSIYQKYEQNFLYISEKPKQNHYSDFESDKKYKTIGLRYALNNAAIGISTDIINNKTVNLKDINAEYFTGAWGFEYYYLNNKGYKLDDSNIDYSGMKVVTTKMSIYHILQCDLSEPDKRINYEDFQTDKAPLKFIYGFFFRFSPGYTSIHNSSGIIPPGDRQYYEQEISEITDLKDYKLAWSAGAKGVFPWNEFFIAAGLDFGYSLDYITYRNNSKTGKHFFDPSEPCIVINLEFTLRIYSWVYL